MKMEVAFNNKRSVEDAFGDLKENLHRGKFDRCKDTFARGEDVFGRRKDTSKN